LRKKYVIFFYMWNRMTILFLAVTLFFSQTGHAAVLSSDPVETAAPAAASPAPAAAAPAPATAAPAPAAAVPATTPSLAPDPAAAPAGAFMSGFSLGKSSSMASPSTTGTATGTAAPAPSETSPPSPYAFASKNFRIGQVSSNSSANV
jgi:hypothetical protein